jgi:hypothetical protein
MTEKTVINIDEVPLADRGNGKQFAVKWGRVGPLVGLNSLGCAVHVVPRGKKAVPTTSVGARMHFGPDRRSGRSRAYADSKSLKPCKRSTDLRRSARQTVR